MRKIPIPMTIAIDGPAASGKTTLAEKLAERLGYLFFDTGLMYRAVTLAAINTLNQLELETEGTVKKIAEESDIDVKPPSVCDGRKCDVFLNGVDITHQLHLPEVDAIVSRVSAFPGVRHALTTQQRTIGLRGKVVMVGRDIGTVVLPEADLKIYLDASIEERALRRFKELTARGVEITYETVLESLRRRDQVDSSRDVAPLVVANDAILIHTDGINIEKVVAKVMELVEKGKFK
jgi:cytidylate kinase